MAKKLTAPKDSAKNTSTSPLSSGVRQRRRKELIDAAREVFYETHYVTATVEDIIHRAAISRPTFYRYFRDKDAVLREILLEDVTAQSLVWRKLAALQNPSEKQLKEWAQRFLENMRRHARTMSLFNVATGMDTSLVHEFSLIRDSNLRLLGEGIKAFRMKGDGSRRDAERRAAAHLLFYQLDQLCMNFAFPDCDLDETAMLVVFARNFLRFVETYG